MGSWSTEAFYHTVLDVSDLDASIAFYKNLGFKLLDDRRDAKWPDFVGKNFGLERAQGRGALMCISPDHGATMIDLIEWVEPKKVFPAPSDQSVPRIIALRVSNVAQAYEELLGGGIEFTNGLVGPLEGHGVVGVACCRDPDGTIVELIELAPGLRHSQANTDVND